ncbi:MAG: helix-turn-helix domain-containing protein [Clostridia bacterium]|nr:helix-turn-helix domain-containing protein [Clostridia bacterium]
MSPKTKYNNELTQRAKLIYGEISSLSNKMGHCFATNNYFAKLYRCTNRTIQNAISKL